jgi:hypothetical protein
LPSPRQFIEAAARNILLGVSLVVVFPDLDLLNGFTTRLIRSVEYQYSHRQVDLATQDRPVLEFLKAELYGVEECLYLEQIVESESSPNFLILDHFEACNPQYQATWFKAISRWSEKYRSIARSGNPKAMILPILAESLDLHKGPEPDTHLVYMTWAGIMSALEIRMVCRMNQTGKVVEDQWREYLLASLSGGDIDLCQHLWDAVLEGVEKIQTALEEYAFLRNWTGDQIPNRMATWRSKPPGQEPRLLPSEVGFDLISQGLTVYTPEYGEEENTAVLAYLDRNEEIRHRIWRAQAALILPIIDDIRRRVCELTTRSKGGTKWAYLENRQLDVPMDLGELCAVFDRMPEADKDKRQWGEDIRYTLNARNNIAHYQPVLSNVFRKMWNFNRRLHDAR